MKMKKTTIIYLVISILFIKNRKCFFSKTPSKIGDKIVWTPDKKEIKYSLSSNDCIFIRNLKNTSPKTYQKRSSRIIEQFAIIPKHLTEGRKVLVLPYNYRNIFSSIISLKERVVFVNLNPSLDKESFSEIKKAAEEYLDSKIIEYSEDYIKYLQLLLNIEIYTIYTYQIEKYLNEFYQKPKQFYSIRILKNFPSPAVLRRCRVDKRILSLIYNTSPRAHIKMQLKVDIIIQEMKDKIRNSIPNEKWREYPPYNKIIEYFTSDSLSIYKSLDSLSSCGTIRRKRYMLKEDFCILFTLADLITKLNDINSFASIFRKNYEEWKYPLIVWYNSCYGSHYPLLMIKYRDKDGNINIGQVIFNNENIKIITEARTIKDLDGLTFV